jgi:hypothetical protein
MLQPKEEPKEEVVKEEAPGPKFELPKFFDTVRGFSPLFLGTLYVCVGCSAHLVVLPLCLWVVLVLLFLPFLGHEPVLDVQHSLSGPWCCPHLVSTALCVAPCSQRAIHC